MLEKLEEMQTQAYLNMLAIQKYCKTYYDSKLEPKVLKENDLILHYDDHFSKKLGKFKMCWIGPYRILKNYPNGSIELQDFNKVDHFMRNNDHCLKLYITSRQVIS
jgi:hypothetical protein